MKNKRVESKYVRPNTIINQMWPGDAQYLMLPNSNIFYVIHPISRSVYQAINKHSYAINSSCTYSSRRLHGERRGHTPPLRY